MDLKRLEEIKEEVQGILDKNLGKKERFSIMDFDEECVFWLIDLLLEKDDSKREKIRRKIEKKRSIHKMKLELKYKGIKEIRDKLDLEKEDRNDMAELKEKIKTGVETRKQLKKI